MAPIGRVVWLTCCVLALTPESAGADFDPTYEALFTLSFEPDQEVDFDDLVAGVTLMPGDPIAAGVTFGGVGNPAKERALVVDTGDGDLALRQVDLGAEGAPDLSRIVFSFDEDVRSVGADLAALGSRESNPNTYIYDAASQELNFISVGDDVIGFLGWAGTDESVPTRFLEYQYVGVQPDTPLTVDDLAVLYVPEPAAAHAGIAGLTGLSILARRRRRAARARRVASV